MVFVWKKYMDFLGKITRKDFIRRIVRGGKKGIFFCGYLVRQSLPLLVTENVERVVRENSIVESYFFKLLE